MKRRLGTHRHVRVAAAGFFALFAATFGTLAVPASGATPAHTHGTDAGTLAPPAVPPQGQAYLGAWVQPNQPRGSESVPIEASDLGNFQAELGRPLGLVHVYQAWNHVVKNSMLNELSSEGAIPVIDWGCSTDSPFVTTTDIVNNTNDVDAYIRSYAEQLKAYGKPVFLRWLWEFNIESPPATFYRDCIETVPGTANPATDGPEYQLAFQDIWKIFKGPGGVGAANVSFVWNPGLAGNLNLSFLQQYYPGAQYVDWVGVDGYSRPVPTELMGNPIAANPTFPTLFTSIVNLLSTNFPDPIMIGETGATNQENTPTHQAVYLQGALTALQTPPFADVGAFNYYDATNNLLQGDDGTWTLTTASGGFQAFAAMGQSSYFSFTGSQ